MRARTDIFAATFEELRDYDVPPEGPGEFYSTVSTNDVDVAVLWELCRIVLDTDLESFLRDTHLVSGPESIGEIDKPTIELLPGFLIDALLSIGAEDLVWLADRWADVPDWRGVHSANELTMILVALAQLASIAIEEERLLFLWTSLVDDEADDVSVDEDDEEDPGDDT